jgi:tetratricopeptide (TPR) repeat protein
MRSFWLALLLIPTLSFGQSDDTAQRIYKSSQDSVFLVYLNDSSGSPTALGSAFLVAKRTLVTNAHVADAGSPVLAVGPVRLPLKVVRIDRKNDLAILSVDVDLTSSSLPLATGTVSPGEEIFAIGNPEGLEKTISQGIVSGLRNRDDRNLLQITSPISHGSSGGPILNVRGEVVGVAVGMLEDGQNLNFAVPVSYVKSILEATSDATAVPIDLRSGLDEMQSIINKRGEYSNDDNSEYQRKTKRLIELMKVVVSEATSEKDLRDLACIGTLDSKLSDDGITAARKLSQNSPSSANRALLAYVLYDRAGYENIVATYGEKGSKAMADAVAARKQYLLDAERESQGIVHNAKGDDLLVASFVLGSVNRDEGNYAEAIPFHIAVATKALTFCGNDLSNQALQALIYENDNAKRPDEAERWFRRYAALHEPGPYEWDSEGDRRAAVSDVAGTVDAYEKAASGSAYYAYDYCYATPAAVLMPNQADRVLADGRKCVEASVHANSNNQRHFTKELPIVYSDMAQILEQRGVYQQALEYIKESLNATPDNPYALSTEADILSDLGRNSECIAASTAAIKVSDGKYPWMQFRLGNCYFATEDWAHAATSFRLSAEADKTDAASAFNLGLSLQRQSFSGDAQQWFREALNRKPTDELRAKILRALTPTAPSNTVARTPPTASGSYCSEAIETHITGEFKGWDGETIYKMDNGSIWEQSMYRYHYHYAYHPQVLIYQSASGACHIKVDGDDDEGVDVRRVK